jgi:RNA polymerase sigma factor (TIGR02999 family)
MTYPVDVQDWAAFNGIEPDRWQTLAPLVDRDLHRTAAAVLRRCRVASLVCEFQPAELVSELYLRLLRDYHRQWDDRSHFFSYAAATMRSVLIDRLRAGNAVKRPQSRKGRPLDGLLARDEPWESDRTSVIEIRIAVQRLRHLSPRQAEVVRLRFFEGLGFDEVGRLLDISEKTARRDWGAARAFLQAELAGKS